MDSVKERLKAFIEYKNLSSSYKCNFLVQD